MNRMTDVRQRKRSESGSPGIQSPVVQDVIDRCRRRKSNSSENLSDAVKSATRRSSLRRQNSTEEKKQQQKPKLNIDRFLRRQASSSSSKLSGKRVVSRSFANSWISDRSYSVTPTGATKKSKNVVIRRGRVKKRKKNENSHWKDVELLLYPKYLQYSYAKSIFSFTKMKKKSKINVEDIDTVTCKEGEDDESSNCN